jgi:hypothetical protein
MHTIYLPTIEAKLYIPSTIKTRMNLADFCFWADKAVKAMLKVFAILQKYPTFESVFFFMAKKIVWFQLKC